MLLQELKNELYQVHEQFKESITEEYDVTLPSGKVLKYKKGYRDYSDYHVIFTLDDQLFRVTGYYDSWSGRDFDDPIGSLEEVEEVEKVVKVYQPKRS